jgi:hypothetical protein
VHEDVVRRAAGPRDARAFDGVAHGEKPEPEARAHNHDNDDNDDNDDNEGATDAKTSTCGRSGGSERVGTLGICLEQHALGQACLRERRSADRARPKAPDRRFWEATDRRLCAVFAASRPLMFCALVGVLSPSGSLRNARHLATGRARPDR